MGKNILQKPQLQRKESVKEIIEESLRNKKTLEEIRMCVNWTDNCCWC